MFENFAVADLPATATRISDALEQEDGLEALFDEMQDALSWQLREPAYALACEMAATDGVLTDEEMQILELVRHRLGIDRLIAAGIDASPTFWPLTSLNSSLSTKEASAGGRLMIRQTAFAVTMSFGWMPPPSGVNAPA